MKQQVTCSIPAVYFLLARNLSLVGCSPAEPTSVSVLNAKFRTTNYIYNLQNFPTTFNLVQTSCGFGVPMYTYTGERDIHFEWAETKGADGLNAYLEKNNLVSLDGLETDWGVVKGLEG